MAVAFQMFARSEVLMPLVQYYFDHLLATLTTA